MSDRDLASRLDRRAFLRRLAEGTALLAAGPGLAGLLAACAREAEHVVASATPGTPATGPGSAVKADLILRSSRPIDLETPVGWFERDLTPTEAFFVRTHHDEPRLDAATWRLRVEGMVGRPVELTLADLQALPRHEVTAVLQCSGNGRAFFEPKVPGVPWEKGAVGNARWAGARLADVLAKAGVGPGAKHVVLQGADRPVLPTTPRFGRSIPLEKALHPDTLVAYEMNGEPLPYLHGYPARLVVPGWVGDDWVKWLGTLRVQDREFEGFFMQTAYRYPKRPVEPGAKVLPADTAPMSEMVVKSLIAAPLAGARVPRGPVPVRGVAWTGGDARITKVEVSADGGRTWAVARLEGEDRPYAWRRWAFDWTAAAGRPGGAVTFMARATDDRGRVQPVGASPWNPSGYQWNAADHVEVLFDV